MRTDELPRSICIGISDPKQRHAPLVLRAMWRGLGRHGACDISSPNRGFAATQPRPRIRWLPSSPNSRRKPRDVIFLFMAGAPSHLDLFDYKPQLAKFDGTLPPADLLKGYRAAFINPNSKLLGPKFKFAKYGQSGAELSELLPYTCRRSSTTSPSSNR